MAMTSAERQKKFRENQRKKGLWKRDEWRDADGLFAPKHPNGSFVTMTLKELEKGIENLSKEWTLPH